MEHAIDKLKILERLGRLHRLDRLVRQESKDKTDKTNRTDWTVDRLYNKDKQDREDKQGRLDRLYRQNDTTDWTNQTISRGRTSRSIVCKQELKGQKNRTNKVGGNRGGHLKLSQRNAALEDWKLVREDDKPDEQRAEKTGKT
jgi:hypothetical protein